MGHLQTTADVKLVDLQARVIVNDGITNYVKQYHIVTFQKANMVASALMPTWAKCSIL